MDILEIREKIPNDIFSVLELNHLLVNYRNKQAKIASMIRKEEIIPLKRGLYTFRKPLRKNTLNSGVLANKIYGPSYVSCEYALSYYGLIPERVETVTSISMGRSRSFNNDFGTFSYQYYKSKVYSIGIRFTGVEENRFLIACKEKALFDKVYIDKRFDGENIEEYLFDDLRIDEDELSSLDKSILLELKAFMNGRMRKLYNYLEEL